MSETKPNVPREPTSASLRAAEELIEGWDSADDLDVDLPRIIAVAIDSAKRAALGQAAEIAGRMYQKGGIGPDIAAAIRALMEGK